MSGDWLPHSSTQRFASGARFPKRNVAIQIASDLMEFKTNMRSVASSGSNIVIGQTLGFYTSP
ncbi:MAG: hypothetical protein R8M38_00040 [Mariprofundaceae bacterium]